MKCVSRFFLLTALTVGMATNAMAWDLWDSFVQEHYDNGRVIDKTDQHDLSTSEGQAYGLFFALVSDDRKRFDEILAWTETNLSPKEEIVPSPWLYGWDPVSKEYKVLDPNNATDADLWIVYCLLEGGRIWNDESLKQKGLKGLQKIKEKYVEIPFLGKILPAGSQGFSKGKVEKVNPSYFPIFVLRRLAKEDPSFEEIAAACLRAIYRSSHNGVAPDWVSFDRHGQADLTQALVGSYDAIRTYLWSGMTSPEDPDYAPMKLHFKNAISAARTQVFPSEKIDTESLKFSKERKRYFAAAFLPYLKNERAGGLARRLLFTEGIVPSRYYGNVLTLFGLGFDDGEFYFDSDGQLHRRADVAVNKEKAG